MRMDETRRRGGEGDIYDGTGMVDSEVNENDFIVLVSRLRSATLSDRKRGGRRWGKRIAIPPRDLQKSVRYKGLGGRGGKSGKRAENFMYSRNSIPSRGGFFKENFSNIMPRFNGSSSVRE